MLAARFAGRQIHGELWKSHVPKFKSHQVRPRVVFQLAHVSLSCLNTCLIQVLTRVIFLLVHTSCLPLGHVSPPGSDTWHLPLCPHGTLLFCHESFSYLAMWCLKDETRGLMRTSSTITRWQRRNKKGSSGLVVVGRRPCEPLNNPTLLSLGGGIHLKRESHPSPIGLVF